MGTSRHRTWLALSLGLNVILVAYVALAVAMAPAGRALTVHFGLPEDGVAVGSIVAVLGESVQSPQWLHCSGVEVPSSRYPELSGAIGVLYGAAEIGHFRLPRLDDVWLFPPGEAPPPLSWVEFVRHEQASPVRRSQPSGVVRFWIRAQ